MTPILKFWIYVAAVAVFLVAMLTLSIAGFRRRRALAVVRANAGLKKVRRPDAGLLTRILGIWRQRSATAPGTSFTLGEMHEVDLFAGARCYLINLLEDREVHGGPTIHEAMVVDGIRLSAPPFGFASRVAEPPAGNSAELCAARIHGCGERIEFDDTTGGRADAIFASSDPDAARAFFTLERRAMLAAIDGRWAVTWISDLLIVEPLLPLSGTSQADHWRRMKRATEQFARALGNQIAPGT